MSDYQITGDGRTVEGWFVDEQPIASGGYGGHQAILRAKKPALTRWTGRDLFALTLPMLLHDGGGSIRDTQHDLDLLASGGAAKEPPVVQVSGHIDLPARCSGDWVIQDPGWGKVWKRGDLVPVRQEVTVVLLEQIDDRLLAASTLTTRPGGRAVVEHYRVHHGDTLWSIAARKLGDGKRWGDIAVLNGLRSSGQLHAGMLLTLP